MISAPKQSSVAGSKAGKGRHIRPIFSAMAERIWTKFSQVVPNMYSYLSISKNATFGKGGIYSLIKIESSIHFMVDSSIHFKVAPTKIIH